MDAVADPSIGMREGQRNPAREELRVRPKTMILGDYRLLEVLGEGGMGVVWRAEHVQTGQLVAIKTVQVADKEVLQSLRREIRALARIRHPGVVRIVDEGVKDGLPWYAMELLEGTTLHRYGSALSGGASSHVSREWWTLKPSLD